MKELMIHVERAVRPIQASPARKRRMRQELLAHLTTIFDEERAKGVDEPTALAQALRRFGDPAELSPDLQALVPRMERWSHHQIELFFKQPGEHGLRLATLIAMLVCGELILLPLVRVAAGENWSHVSLGLGGMTLVTGYAFISALMGFGFCHAIVGRPDRNSLVRAVGYAAGGCLVGLAMIVGGYFIQPDNALWEFLLHHPRDPLAMSGLFWFIGAPVALSLLAALIYRIEKARERRYGDWASLEIGE